MLVSLAEIVILSVLVDWAFRKLTLPGLVGMLLLGVVIGPFALDWIHPALLTASTDLRVIALIVILLRAGFELSRETLHRVGGRVLLLSALPAILEGAAITVLGPWLLGLSYLHSAILGAVLGAVSPAVVVPMMIGFIERNMGTAKAIPTMVLAASAIDDAFVIVVYSVLVGTIAGHQTSLAWSLAGIPISIVLGGAAGIAGGLVLFALFRRFDPRVILSVTKRVLVILGVAVLLVRLEQLSAGWVPFAALIAVMGLGAGDPGHGHAKAIPTMVLAASAIDDAFVIVVYSVLVGTIAGHQTSLAWSHELGIPISIVLWVFAEIARGGCRSPR